MSEKIYIPKNVTIETIFGCNASCPMCVIDLPSKRKKGLMSLELSTKVMEELAQYKDSINQVDMFALGEPILDPHIFDRIEYGKKLGFKNIGISTNADPLNAERQRKLLASGLDTLLFSIDGTRKDTHEKIRVNTVFERVVENCKSTIRLRDEGDYSTKIIIRFIRQEKNRDEWEEFKEYWLPYINAAKGDFLAVYDMHSWGGELATKAEILEFLGIKLDDKIEAKPCQHFMGRLVVLANGTVPLCHEDILSGEYSFGNANDESVIDIYNNSLRNKFRQEHTSGNKNNNPMCRECTVHYSEPLREFVNPHVPVE